MRKSGLVIISLMLALATPAMAVRYGIKSLIQPFGTGQTPTYLGYSPISDRMYSGNAGYSNVTAMSCAGDSLLGVVNGASGPAKMVYDSVNNRVYYMSGDMNFYAINCVTDSATVPISGMQGSTSTAYNPVNQKIYFDKEFNNDVLIHSASGYTYLGSFADHYGTIHYCSGNNSVYVPDYNSTDTLGVFSGATDLLVADIRVPLLGASGTSMKMASNPAVSRLYVSLPSTDQVAIINTSTNTLTVTRAVADNPNNFALCPVNNRMFIACNGTSQYSLKYINGSDVLDSVRVGDSVSTVVYNPSDSLIYIGCRRSGYVKLVDPRLANPAVVDSVYTVFRPQFEDMSVDKGGDVYCAVTNSDNIIVIGKIPRRIWQSNMPTGLWSDVASWQYSDDNGAIWNTGGIPDCSTDSLVTIVTGTTIQQTVGGPGVTADQLVVNGTLEVLANLLTIADGPGDDIVVNGSYQFSGGTFTLDPGATMVFGPNSYYYHYINGGNLPVASWDTLSNLKIYGVTNAIPTGMNQAFGNIEWNCSAQETDMTLPGGPSFSVRNLVVSSTSDTTGVAQGLYLTSAAKPTVTVNNLTLSSTSKAVLGSGGPRKLHVLGDFAIYDPAWLYLTDTLNAGIDTLFLYGNYAHLVSGIGGGGPDSTTIAFCGTGTQTYMANNEVLTGHVNYLVRPGSHLLIPESNNMGQGSLGDFTLMAGATLSYSDFQGLYPSGQDTGSIRNLGGRNFSQGANYRLYGNGTGPYVTGPGIPDTVRQLIVESSFDQAYLSKDLAVMDTLKLLGNNLRIDGKRLSLFGPILQTTGNMMGDSLSQMVIMGGNTQPVTLPGMVRDLGLLNINRPATVSMSDTMLIHKRLELVNGIIDNGGRKLSFRDRASIFRNGNGSLAGAGPIVFVNRINLEYGGGTITAGLELPTSPNKIGKFRLQNAADTVIVSQDSLGIGDSLFLPGAIRFSGRFFNKTGFIDSTGPVGLLQMTDSCSASFISSPGAFQLPAITGGRLTIDNTGGGNMRGDISLSGQLRINIGSLKVGPHTLAMGDSLIGATNLNTDSTSSLVFQGNAVTQAVPSTVNNLSKLSWNRPGFMSITAALVLHDTLHLGQGMVNNSGPLILRSGVTIIRNSGNLMNIPTREGPTDVIYKEHGGGRLTAGNELPGNATDLNDLVVNGLTNDTLALSGDVQVNGTLDLQQGALAVGGNNLTLRDTLILSAGDLLADSLSGITILNCPYPFVMPNNISLLNNLDLNSPAGMTFTDTLNIRTQYRQTNGHILAGQLQYGPSSTLWYFFSGLDTTSSLEFPVVGGPYNLNIGTGNILQLNASRTITGTLTLGAPVNTGANTLTLGPAGTVNPGAGYVQGRLAKWFPVSADTVITYQLGIAGGGHSPVDVRVFNNTVPAFVTAAISGSGHPLTDDPSSSLRKYWTLEGAPAADASLVTLHYLNSDFNSPNFTEAAHESTMVAGRYDLGATPGWYFPAVTARGIGSTNDGGTITVSQAGNFGNIPAFTLARDSASIYNPAADTSLPYIISNLPSNGAVNVGLTDSVRITFSEPVRKSGVSYTFVPNPGVVDTAWSADSTAIVFNHSAFANLTSYTVRVLGVQDTAFNVLTGRDSIRFTTLAFSDTVHPAVALVGPVNGATGVLLQQQLTVRFSEPMDTASFRFRCIPDPLYWNLAWSSGDSLVTLSHGDFTPGTLYGFRVDSAADKSGNTMLNPPYQWSFTSRLPDSLSYSLTGGVYRMFSVPLSPVDSTPAQILGDELGAYSDSTWRIFGYKPALGYVERPNLSSGHGYWLATSGNATVEVKGTRLLNFFSQPVDSGWNLVGNPFDTTVTLSNINILWRDTSGHFVGYTDPLVNGVLRQRMYNWQDASSDFVNNGTWDSLTPYVAGDRMIPWGAYAVYAVRPCTLRMGRSKGEPQGVQPKAPQYAIDWQLNIDVVSGQAVDRGVKLGVSAQAREDYDRLDAEKPPLISNTVKAFIPHRDWNQGPCQEYQQDFRPVADYIEWPLMIEAAGTAQPVVLSSQITGELGNGGYLYLLDRRKGKTFDLKTHRTVGFSGPQELAVVYSSKPFDGRTLTPLSFGLGRIGPNPFVQRITVNYQLPQAGLVSMSVYNIAGQRVRSLVSQNLPPGYYSQVWDGRNDGGRVLSAGVYIIRLSASGRSAAQKIVKLQ